MECEIDSLKPVQAQARKHNRPLSPLPVVFVFLLTLLIGCIQDASLPYVGNCTTAPSGVYEYGQIPPGNCLSGPVELHFEEDLNGDPVLLVTNSNPYQVFDNGSLLSIPWSAVDLGTSRNPVMDIDSEALELPSFAAGLARSGDLGLVTLRLSEDARTREDHDDVLLIDLSNLPSLSFSDRGTNGGHTVTVGADPVDVVVDAINDRAFVANRTDHSISILDLGGEEVEVVIPWSEYALSSAEFIDGDDSGSRASLANLDAIDSTLIPDDLWSLTWIAGTWRLWLPSEAGIFRTQTTGDGLWHESGMGIELEVENAAGLIDSITDPDWFAGRMLYADGGDLHSAITGSWLGDWSYESFELLQGRAEKWDESLSGPAMVVSDDGLWLFFDGTDGLSRSIGTAYSEDGYTFTRQDQPVLEPMWDHELAGIADPALVFDSEIDLWRMFYSAFDGENWTIGHATSPDLIVWESDEAPLLSLDGGDIAAPVLSRSVGEWHLWASARSDGEWNVIEAHSNDGQNWSLGPLLFAHDESVAYDDEPPGVALDADPDDSLRVEGENWGLLRYTAEPGVAFLSVDHGWAGTPVAGFELDLGDAGNPSAGGITVDCVLPDENLAYLTIESSGGIERIGIATIEEDGRLAPEDGFVLQGSSGFHQGGVSSPVVFDDGDQFRMYFAGMNGGLQQIGTATSVDGLNWTIADSPVLTPEFEWESAGMIPGSIERLDDGQIRLWYSASNGEDWRISSATRNENGTFARDAASDDWIFESGALGEWDDTGVRDPWVVPGLNEDGNSGIYLFYAGYDGELWRGGVAFRPDGGDFERTVSERTGSTRAVLSLTGGMFHPDGIRRPIMVQDEQGWHGWFSGILNEQSRVGTMKGPHPTQLHKTPRRPSLGDALRFTTERGDPEIEAIPLDTEISELSLTGLGLIALHVDEQRGLMYALTKHQPWIVAIDIRDDSNADEGFSDLNTLDIEAVIRVQASSGGAGFRQVLEIDGMLYGLNDDPDSIFVLDLSELNEDQDAFAEILYDTQVGGLTAARDLTSDEGLENTTSMGPGQMALHADGRRLLVTNFNDNSVSVYDLSLGTHGQLIQTISLIGENPYAIAIHGDYAVVGNFYGETDSRNVTQSTLAVIDLNEESATYLEVLTWIVND